MAKPPHVTELQTEFLIQLQHDANLTLRTLDREGDAFDWTFMRDLRDLPTRFDTVIR